MKKNTKTTTINMKDVGDNNPFYTAVWTDVSPEEEKEVFAIIDQINKENKEFYNDEKKKPK